MYSAILKSNITMLWRILYIIAIIIAIHFLEEFAKLRWSPLALKLVKH